jgi:hypothetical protein
MGTPVTLESNMYQKFEASTVMKVQFVDRVKMEAAKSSESLVSYHIT